MGHRTLCIAFLILGCGSNPSPTASSVIDAQPDSPEQRADSEPPITIDASSVDSVVEEAEPDAFGEVAPESSRSDAREADGDAAIRPVSRVCGDSIRDPVREECDDGPAGGDDACTDDCRARWFGWLQAGADASSSTRTLGSAQHVVSAGDDGFAVAYVDRSSTSSSPMVWLQTFDEVGHRRGAPIAAASGYEPTAYASPVVASVRDGIAVAWTDGASGTPDVRVRMIKQNGATIETLAHTSTAGLQEDADLLWTGSELLVAWTDLFDVRMRRFDGDLKPLGDEKPLAPMAGIESNVTLAPWGSSFAAAFRANDGGLESIGVVADGVTWSTAPALPGPSGDRPALVPLDDAHLLLVFAQGVDSSDPDGPSTGNVRAALMSKASPGPVETFALAPAVGDGGASSSGRGPSAVRVDGQVFVLWRDASAGGSDGDLHTVMVMLDPENPSRVRAMDVAPLQRSTAIRENGRLASSPLFPGGALITVWEARPNMGAEAALMLELRPWPFVHLDAALPPLARPW